MHRTYGRQDALSCAGYLREEGPLVAASLDALPRTHYNQGGVTQIFWGQGAYLGRGVHRDTA